MPAARREDQTTAAALSATLSATVSGQWPWRCTRRGMTRKWKGQRERRRPGTDPRAPRVNNNHTMPVGNTQAHRFEQRARCIVGGDFCAVYFSYPYLACRLLLVLLRCLRCLRHRSTPPWLERLERKRLGLQRPKLRRKAIIPGIMAVLLSMEQLDSAQSKSYAWHDSWRERFDIRYVSVGGYRQCGAICCAFQSCRPGPCLV